jgi:hypothetical protein
MLTMVRYFLANGAKKFITKYSKQALEKVKAYIKNNKEKVSKMKTNVKQEPVEKLPLFKKLDKKFVDKNYDYSYLTKGTDISKGMGKK